MSENITTVTEAMRSLEPYNNSPDKLYTDPVSVLKHVILSAQRAMETVDPNISHKIFPTFPAGTIFTRTCKSPFNLGPNPKRTGGFCGFDLDQTTTFANLSPLGNLAIRNQSTQKNDSVVFLRTTEELSFINFVLISQIIGVQIKSGSPHYDASNSRGIFSACCPLMGSHMVDLCAFFKCVGIIQTDSVDAVSLDDTTDVDIQEMASSAIQQGFALPGFNPENNSIESPNVDKALFPEFAFHAENLSSKLQYVNITNTDGRTDPLFRYGGPLFWVQNTSTNMRTYEKNEGLEGSLLVDVFSLDSIAQDPKAREQYLSFQFDKFVCALPIVDSDLPRYMSEYYSRRDLINSVFNNSNFIVLPYWTRNNQTNDGIFIHFCKLMRGRMWWKGGKPRRKPTALKNRRSKTKSGKNRLKIKTRMKRSSKSTQRKKRKKSNTTRKLKKTHKYRKSTKR